MTTNRRWWSGMLRTEDWWSVWIGLAIFAASLLSLAGADLVGWMARPRPWTSAGSAGGRKVRPVTAFFPATT